MKKLISDFESKDVIDFPLLIKAVSKGVTDKGEPYLTISLQDKSASITGKLWKATNSDEEVAQVGKVVDVVGDVIEYNKSLQVRIKSIKPADYSKIDFSDLVMRSSMSKEEFIEIISENINKITSPIYRSIISEVFKRVGDDFYQYPAASKIHHSFIGGLAQHVCGMLKLANSICDLYDQLDRDLLISGVLIHDIGKMVEFTGPLAPEYSLEGKLIGHISIMHGKLVEIIDDLNLRDKEESILLRHMLLSHHGKLEYGSPVLPLLQEAEVLYFIDNIDARLNTLETALKSTKEGAFTPRLFPLENRSFYKPKK